MPWVNRTGYSPGKRHFTTGVLVEDEPRPDYRPGVIRIPQRMSEPSLCAEGRLTGERIARSDGGKEWANWGRLSIVDNVNLNQRNLCSYCVRKFVRDIRPDLLPAFNAMKTGVVT